MRLDFDENCTVGCTGIVGVGVLAISGLALACAGIQPSVSLVALAIFGLFIGLGVTLLASDGPRPVGLVRAKRFPGPVVAAPPKPAVCRLEPVAHEEPAWKRAGSAMTAVLEARTRRESLFIAVLAAAAIQSIATVALFSRSGGHELLTAVGAAVFLPVALAPLTAVRGNAGDRAATVATVVAALGASCNIGLALTVWFAAPPFGRPDRALFATHPGRDFLWSPFAGAGGAWFLAGLATLVVSRMSRSGGLPGGVRDSREAVAWWMNGLPVLSLLAYGLTVEIAGR